MRRLSYLQVGLACMLAFVLAWAPALAQDAGSLPQVDWPSESRFVTSMAETQAPPQLMVVAWPCESRFGAMTPDTIAHMQAMAADAWPCEARYVALVPVAVAQATPMASVDWPCEARFVTGSEHGPVMAATEWPCEARFVALVPYAPAMTADALAQIDWPSETRFDPQLALAVYIGPAEPILAMTEMEANKLLHRTPLQAFFLGDDPGALSEVYPEELALAREAEWRSWQTAFSELEATLDFQVAEGDRVVSCWTFSGMQTGEFMGMAPTDAPTTFQVLYAAQIVDGHIVSEIGQLDAQTMRTGPDVEEGPQTS
jgi:hypothetical protein